MSILPSARGALNAGENHSGKPLRGDRVFCKCISRIPNFRGDRTFRASAAGTLRDNTPDIFGKPFREGVCRGSGWERRRGPGKSCRKSHNDSVRIVLMENSRSCRRCDRHPQRARYSRRTTRRAAKRLRRRRGARKARTRNSYRCARRA